MAGEAQQVPAEAVEWWDVWGRLKQIITQLDAAVASLEASREYALSRPNLADEYRAKMAEVQAMKDRAVWLRDTIRNVLSTFGVELSGLAARAVRATAEPQQLGIIPWLVWPVVAAGLTWLGNKALDLYQFAQRVEEQKRLESQGMSPQQAAAIITQQIEAGTVTGAARTLGTGLVVAGLALAAWWFFIRGRD